MLKLLGTTSDKTGIQNVIRGVHVQRGNVLQWFPNSTCHINAFANTELFAYSELYCK